MKYQDKVLIQEIIKNYEDSAVVKKQIQDAEIKLGDARILSRKGLISEEKYYKALRDYTLLKQNAEVFSARAERLKKLACKSHRRRP